ncbi:hypothetical protein MTR67_007428 [Solanum verrucosum]|uniref:DUF4283 domain-containing protein n=1 Tax=Solanum verrucosum TaxID=315347 RepID=A0AAF0Q079_SOLVR|nr:hypothetical protein MTR67_007428 [Solanum verrucosum]
MARPRKESKGRFRLFRLKKLVPFDCHVTGYGKRKSEQSDLAKRVLSPPRSTDNEASEAWPALLRRTSETSTPPSTTTGNLSLVPQGSSAPHAVTANTSSVSRSVPANGTVTESGLARVESGSKGWTQKIVELPKVEIDKETQKWKTVLIFYVIGASQTIASLERFIASKWSSTAKSKIHCHDDGYFVLKCTYFEDRNEILCAGPQMPNASLLLSKLGLLILTLLLKF